jgi:hypothetical protein
MNIPPYSSKIDPFIPIEEDPDYKPKTANMDKIKHYKSVE